MIPIDGSEVLKHDDSHLNGSVERSYMDIEGTNKGADYETKFVQPTPWEIRQEFEYEIDLENNPNFMEPASYGTDICERRFAADQFGNRL